MDTAQAKVLITGGSSGIGLETARLLRADGAKVAICARQRDRLEKAAAEIDALPIVGDVAVEADVQRMVLQVVESFGDYDVLINNAGFGRFGPLLDLELEDFQAVMGTNVYGAMLVARESARHFVQRGGGNIVNVASTAALKGFANGTAYAASKFALTAMTECWRAELRKHDIRVMQINPSEVVTDFSKAAGYDQQASDRKLRPVDIAHAIRSMLTMEDRGFTTELTVFATNPD